LAALAAVLGVKELLELERLLLLVEDQGQKAELMLVVALAAAHQ
jgi:hypothetical protein